jgi:hypothetical protein
MSKQDFGGPRGDFIESREEAGSRVEVLIFA